MQAQNNAAVDAERGLNPEDREWLLGRILSNECLMDDLAGRYEGRTPFDQSYADEEVEASAARRRGRRRAELDIRADLTCPECGL